jgi:predicted dehydrogenase
MKPIRRRPAWIRRSVAARAATRSRPADRGAGPLGLLVAEAYMIVHHPQWQRARELVQGGAIGRLVHVDAAFSYRLLDMENIRNRPEAGGGSLPTSGSTPLAPPASCRRGARGGGPRPCAAGERGGRLRRLWARFPSFTYSGFTSMRMFPRQEVVFHGEEGLVRVGWGPFNANRHDLAQVMVETSGGARTFERWPEVNHYVLQVENFGRTLRTGAAYPCPLEFSRGTQQMIDMVLETERRR